MYSLLYTKSRRKNVKKMIYSIHIYTTRRYLYHIFPQMSINSIAGGITKVNYIITIDINVIPLFSLEVSLLVKWERTIWGARENSNGTIKATVSSLGCHSGCGFSIV